MATAEGARELVSSCGMRLIVTCATGFSAPIFCSQYPNDVKMRPCRQEKTRKGGGVFTGISGRALIRGQWAQVKPGTTS